MLLVGKLSRSAQSARDREPPATTTGETMLVLSASQPKGKAICCNTVYTRDIRTSMPDVVRQLCTIVNTFNRRCPLCHRSNPVLLVANRSFHVAIRDGGLRSWSSLDIGELLRYSSTRMLENIQALSRTAPKHRHGRQPTTLIRQTTRCSPAFYDRWNELQEHSMNARYCDLPVTCWVRLDHQSPCTWVRA